MILFNIRKALVCFAFSLFTVGALRAADINIDNTGEIPGSYPTISAGIAAATDGDRIVIYPTIYDYKDSLVVNKSLEFICAQNGQSWEFYGVINIVPAPGRTISFIGMQIVRHMGEWSVNGVFASQNNVGGTRCVVNFIDCSIYGPLAFNLDGFEVNAFYSSFWNLEFRMGTIVGSYMDRVFVYEDSPVWGVGDTVIFIGNKTSQTSWGLPFAANFVFKNSNATYFIANNFFRYNLFVDTAYVVDTNGWFINNTVEGSSSMTNWACTTKVNHRYNVVWLEGVKNTHAVNNVFYNTNGSGGCALGNFQGQNRANYNLFGRISYNHHNGWRDNIYVNGSLSYDGNGIISSGTGHNQGHPGIPFYDIDITRNNMGTGGGPFAWSNYHPDSQNAPGRARIYLLDIKSQIYSLTGSVPVKASGVHMK
ncbi:MAG: hypothetical protein H6581_20160 [Bacteroidia bacterium]|nr:hypothetical protein [Bacteroidia bacterium]